MLHDDCSSNSHHHRVVVGRRHHYDDEVLRRISFVFCRLFYVLTDRQTDEKKMYFESFNNRNTTETTNPSFFLCLHEERKQKALLSFSGKQKRV